MANRISVATDERETILSGLLSMVTSPLSPATVTGKASSTVMVVVTSTVVEVVVGVVVLVVGFPAVAHPATRSSAPMRAFLRMAHPPVRRMKRSVGRAHGSVFIRDFHVDLGSGGVVRPDAGITVAETGQNSRGVRGPKGPRRSRRVRPL